MEMDREDGTEFVLSFTVDVNENRAGRCKTHTLQTQNRNSVLHSGPKYRVHSEQARVTSEGAEINGFQEPDGGIKLSLEPKDEFKPDTSGHIRTPDAGEKGYFGELGPNLTQNRALSCQEDHQKPPRFINPVNGENLDLWGVHASPVICERTAGTGGSDGGLIASGETPSTIWLTSGGTVSTHGIDVPLTLGQADASSVSASDVWEIPANTVGVTSAEKADDQGTNQRWTVTGDATNVGETNGNETGCGPVNMLEENGDNREFNGSPAVIGESVSNVEPSGNQTTSEQLTFGQFTHFNPISLLDGSGSKDSDTISQETGSMTGIDVISTAATTPEETTNPLRTCLHMSTAGVIVGIGGTDDELTAPGENQGTRCTLVRSGVMEKSLQICETSNSPRIADEMVDIRGNRASISISGETECTRRTSARPGVAEDNSLSVSKAYTNQNTPGETSGTGNYSPGPRRSLTVYGNRSKSDGKTAAAVTDDHVPETSMNLEVAGAVDGAAPQDQVIGNPSQVNNATKAKFATWENPDCPVHPGMCVEKCSGSCCAELDMEILSRDVNCSKREEIYTSETLGKGVRVGNHGYLVINRRSTSGTSLVPVYSIREPGNVAERQQEVKRTSDLGPESILKVSKTNSNEEMKKQEIETPPECGVKVGDGGGAMRPQSLRTNPGQAMSLSCDSTPLSNHNAAYFIDDGDMDVIMNSMELGRRQSAPDKLLENEHVDPEPSSEQTGIKRHTFADFLTRSLFSWKPNEPKASATSSGWRLFGKVSPKGNDIKGCRIPHQPEAVRRKNLEFEPLSTTGLILEDRPANLPAKSEEEAQRHRQQYDEMMAGAKRRELKEAHQKKKQMKERLQQEESIARAVVVWNTEILPNWENMRNTRRARELWWQGLPPSVRGKVWSLAIGNELNITPELYEIFLSRAKEKWRSFSETFSLSESEDGGVDKESSLDLIKLDIFRTFPSLYIFQKGGPYHDVLHNVLGAYTCYRPDVGYVQGMSFIAAVLILNLEEADAFIAFANLLNKPCQLAFFRVDHDLMLKYFAAFEVFFEENLPKLFQHFYTNSLTPDFYLIDWIFTLYSKPLPLDVACRVWDLFCRDGEEALFRTALGILRLYQDVLLHMDFIHIAQFLSRLPQNTPAHSLFTCIANTHMLSNNRRWNQVFSALMKDGPKEADKTGSPALRS